VPLIAGMSPKNRVRKQGERDSKHQHPYIHVNDVADLCQRQIENVCCVCLGENLRDISRTADQTNHDPCDAKAQYRAEHRERKALHP